MSTRITFWRRGFATNSSSAHSLIFSGQKLEDSEDAKSLQFGWDFFTCASPESKLGYLALCLKSNYHWLANMPGSDSIVPYQKVERFVEDMFEEWAAEALAGYPPLVAAVQRVAHDEDTHVDHQSMIGFPCVRQDWNKPHPQFVMDFAKELMVEGYAILGGNDNTEESHPLLGNDVDDENHLSAVYRMLRDGIPGHTLCVFDAKLGEYVLSMTDRGDIVKVCMDPTANRIADAVIEGNRKDKG